MESASFFWPRPPAPPPDIPFFKECIIMATSCDACGERTNEVKSGSGIGEKGVRISLRLTDVADLSRDVLKSETCSFAIPELEFEVLFCCCCCCCCWLLLWLEIRRPPKRFFLTTNKRVLLWSWEVFHWMLPDFFSNLTAFSLDFAKIFPVFTGFTVFFKFPGFMGSTGVSWVFT